MMLGARVGAALTLLLVAGCGGGNAGSGTTSPATTPTAQPPAPASELVSTGKGLYTSKGCNACHSLNGSRIVGPTWKGLAGSSVKLNNGSTVSADAAYLLASIENADKQIVAGYRPGVMSGTIPPGSVSVADAKALVAFIQSLR
jgi:cytochrome c oxidase subunit 2